MPSGVYTDFPAGEVFSEAARNILQTCKKKFSELPPDEALMRAIETEYQLFQSVERVVCQNARDGQVFQEHRRIYPDGSEHSEPS